MNNKIASGLICLTVGLLTGGAIVWMYEECKYESIVKEEIDSVKRTYDKKLQDYIQEEKAKQINPVKSAVMNVAAVKPDISEIVNKMLESENTNVERPYCIDQEEFSEYNDYISHTLDYYTDGILVDADDPDVPIDDVHEIVGDCLDNVREDSKEDWIYVRNDSKKSDYEIYINSVPFTEKEIE